MKEPIFAVFNTSRPKQGYLVVLSSPEAAEAELEPIDIEDNEYAFYDAEGTVLWPELVEASARSREGAWKLRQPPDARREPEVLRDLLVEYLASLGPKATRLAPDSLEQLDLPRLVQVASSFTLR